MAGQQDRPFLSKSRFIRGLQCHKALYLHTHHPELADPVPPEREALFRSGSEVGELAQGLFPGGALIPYEGNSYDGQVEQTRREIEKGTEVIYEAAFSYDGVFVKVDILRRGPGGWEVYEVKSSASMRDYYVPDAAVQHYVVKGAGLEVSGTYLVHINREYVRNGSIELNKLFAIEDLTETVGNMQDLVKDSVEKMRTMLSGDMPVIDIGPHCSSPFDCDFRGRCWQHVPEDSVFTLRQRGVDKFDLYRRGLVRLNEIPLDMLNANQRQQVEASLGEKEYIEKEALRDFLGSIRYPIYFLDFETYKTAVPLYDGTRPYQQVPYQYSLHYLGHEGAPLGHHEFLAEPNTDPREAVAAGLVRQIPDDACVLAYHAQFEKDILRELAATFSRYRKSLEAIIKNVVDLAAPFKARQVYHFEMNGSYSQKVILPIMVPALAYKGMEVADGMMAMEAYFAMCRSKDPAEIDRIRSALLRYCELDTLGMVRILGRLRELADQGGSIKGGK